METLKRDIFTQIAAQLNKRDIILVSQNRRIIQKKYHNKDREKQIDWKQVYNQIASLGAGDFIWILVEFQEFIDRSSIKNKSYFPGSIFYKSLCFWHCDYKSSQNYIRNE
jgi:hypothetical protein